MPLTAQTSTQLDDLSRRIEKLKKAFERINRLEDGVKKLIELNVELAKSIEALHQSSNNRVVSYAAEAADVGTSTLNRVVLHAVGNAHLKISLSEGGFMMKTRPFGMWHKRH